MSYQNPFVISEKYEKEKIEHESKQGYKEQNKQEIIY